MKQEISDEEFSLLSKEFDPLQSRDVHTGRWAKSKGTSFLNENGEEVDADDEMTDEEFSSLSKLVSDDDGREEFFLEANIEKRDDEKQLVFGWASVAKLANGTEVVDKQGDVLQDIDAMEDVAYHFVLNSRDGGEMHIKKGVSTLVESFVSTPEKWDAMGIPAGVLPVGWWCGWKVNDTAVWERVKKRELTMFSVHGSGLRKRIEE